MTAFIFYTTQRSKNAWIGILECLQVLGDKIVAKCLKLPLLVFHFSLKRWLWVLRGCFVTGIYLVNLQDKNANCSSEMGPVMKERQFLSIRKEFILFFRLTL